MLDHTDLLPTVCDDLLFISKDFHEEIDEAALRRASTVIRRLVVDGDLQRAWLVAGFEREPKVPAIDLDAYMTGVDKSLVVSASAGGAHVGRSFIGPNLIGRFVFSDEQYAERFQRGIPWRDFTLSQFSSGPSLVTEGSTITRRQVVKFIAHKLGGAHHDTKRGDKADDLGFAALDRITKGRPIQVADKSPVYFELLAIGQAIGKSEDLRQLVERVQAGRSRR